MTEDEIMARVREASEEIAERGTPTYPDPMLPPWDEFPDYSRYSIGWRMGSGEDYWLAFGKWFKSLDQTQREKYMAKYPLPEGWSDFYSTMMSTPWRR